MVRTAPLRLYEGGTLDGTIYVKDNGTPANLTGYTATAQIRADFAGETPGPPAATIQCTVTGTGTVDIYLAPSTVLSLPAGPLVWDFKVTNGTDVFPLLRGPVYVGKRVTV